MNETVTLFIEPIDVGKWKLFQQRYEVFSEMEKRAVFDIKYGEATLHFTDGILDFVSKSERYKVMHSII